MCTCPPLDKGLLLYGRMAYKLCALMMQFSVISTILTDCCAFDVDGELRMDVPPTWPNLQKGDMVNFDLMVQLSLDEPQDQLIIVLSGDTLEFINDTVIDFVDWTLDDSSGDTHNRSTLDLDFYESVFVPLNNNLGYAYKLNLTTGLEAGNWTLSGTYQMTVRENIVSGSIVRGVLTVTALWSSRSGDAEGTSSSRSIASNYEILPTGSVTVIADSPANLPIMSSFTAQILYTSANSYSLDAEVEGYTSAETISKEVRLTVQEMLVLVNHTRGITSAAKAKLEKTQSYIVSSLGSYQNDVGTLDLPLLSTAGQDVLAADNVTGPEVAVNFTVRVEDYSLLQDGDQWPVHLGLSFHGNAIWMGVILVTIEAPEVRVPVLRVATTQTGQCAYDGSASVALETIVQHNESTSTGTAYNVTFNLYMPSYLQMSANTFTKPKENNITVDQEGTVISAEIARLTFSDPFVLHMTLTADLGDVQVKAASQRVISYEVVYNDRWGNRTELTSGLAYLSLSVNTLCSKRLTWTTSSDCQCEHDKSRFDCGCCVVGACQCGEPRPHACTPCDEKYRCVAYKSGFEELTYLKSQDIRCDSFYLRRGSATGVSCHKRISGNPDRYLELSPLVGVVTGMDSSTGYFLGIANNGRSYVVSRDGGVTWDPFFDDAYDNFTTVSSDTIEWAEYLTAGF